MITRITIRFTDAEKSIYDALKKSAQSNRRSLNAEMLRAFEVYLNNAGEAKSDKKEVSKKSPK